MTGHARIFAAVTLGIAAAYTSVSHAAVSADEAKQLGTTLTPFGAEKAGNKEGTIPEYNGGLTTPPAGFVPGPGPKPRPDPFPNDKPLYSIDAKNMDKYADKLTEGAKAMMTKHPGFRIDVYPTRRTVAYPQFVLDNTVKNATRCKTVDEGLAIVPECAGGIAFPIPKTGYEVMWNYMTRWIGGTVEFRAKTIYVEPSGKVVETADFNAFTDQPYYDDARKGTGALLYSRGDQLQARSAGNATIVIDYINPVDNGRRAWSYSPGQRRVRVAPDFAYDTPTDGSGGVQLYDEINIFSGKMDRFDFKLAGKKEVFIPYNSYRLHTGKLADVAKPGFINPDLNRWELHRAWVVEATLKPGKRHVYSKRVFYVDEDGGTIVADNYDATGKLWRTVMNHPAPLYDVPATTQNPVAHYDLINGYYVLLSHTGDTGGVNVRKPRPSSFWTPDSLASTGIR